MISLFQHLEWEELIVVGVTQLRFSLCENKNHYCTNPLPGENIMKLIEIVKGNNLYLA